MESSKINTVNQSLGRCFTNLMNGKEFLDTFYDIFLISHSSIKPLFANTDISNQKKLLKQGLMMLVMFAGESSIAQSSIEKLVIKHDHKHLNINPKMYNYWVDSLLKSIKLHDPKFTPEIENDWPTVVAVGIDKMKSGY